VREVDVKERQQELAAERGMTEDEIQELMQEILELYRDALTKVVHKSVEENAAFPLQLAMTNPAGETWSAVATPIDAGKDFKIEHNPGRELVNFLLQITATDARATRSLRCT
jgi:hypothetical protein